MPSKSLRPAKYPKDVLLFLYDPDRKYVHVLVEMKNARGAMGEVATEASHLGLNILNGFTSVDAGQSVGVWSFFAERTERDLQPQQIVEALERSKHVVSVRVAESAGGLLTDSFHFPLRFTPGRTAIGFNPTSVASMFRRVTEAFGTGGQVIIYEEGRAVGKEGAKFLLAAIGKKALLAQLGKVSDLLSGWGWGIVESLECDAEMSEVRVRVSASFESAASKTTLPSCHFMRGTLEGIFEAFSGRDMKAIEETCASQGSDACEFVVSKRG